MIKPRIKIQSIGESSGQAVNLNNSSISDLSNVSITAPSDGQALVWNDASGVWKPGNVAAGGSSSINYYSGEVKTLVILVFTVDTP